MFIYVSLVLIAITAFIVLFNLVKGIIRGLKKTIGSLAAIIISAVLAAIITAVICKPDSSAMTAVIDAIRDMLSGAEFQEIFEIQELSESISYYIAMIAAPFVFVVLYMLLSIIISIVVGIVIKFIPPKKKFKGVANRVGGLGVGVVCGLLVSAILLMPVVGVLNIAISVGQSEFVEDELGDEVSAIVDEAADDQIYAVYSVCSGWMFDSFASTSFDGERIVLKDEISVILALVNNISAISGDVSEFGEGQIESLNNVINNLNKSPLLKNTIAGILSQMASKWIANESFIGVGRIDAGELLNPVIDEVLEVMASSKKDNITQNMTTLIDILAVMVDYDLFDNVNDFDKMLEVLSKEPESADQKTAIQALIDVANANPEMKGLSDEITKLSIRALASTLGIPENNDEKYNMLMDDIADILNDSKHEEDRAAYVEQEMVSVLDEYGVTTGGDAAFDIADSIIKDLGNLENVNSEAVKEFFMMYAIAAQHANDAAITYSGFATLADNELILTTDPTTGAVMMGEYVFKYYNAYSYDQSAAFAAGKSGVDFGEADMLYSAEAMAECSDIITLADIFSAEGIMQFSNLNDEESKLESKHISEMLILAGEMFNGNFTNPNYKLLVKDMGAVLDKMSEMKIFGPEATALLLRAIFQSNVVKSSLGLPIDKLEGYVDTIIENARTSSYVSVTKSVGGMLDMMEKVNNKDASREEKIEVTKELIQNMTPENAQLLSDMATPEMIKDYVKNEEKAETVSNSVSSLFANMADFTVDEGEDYEKEYEKEAHAVNTIIDLATNAASSEKKSMFSKNGEQGKIDADPDEFVSLVVSSEVAGKTVTETLEKEGENPYGIYLEEEDENDLNSALMNRYENRTPDEDETELIKTLTDIALIMNATPPEFN